MRDQTSENRPSAKFRPQEAAEFLGVKKSTLEAWRFFRKGPAYTKVGSRVFYFESDLREFLEAGRVVPAAQG